MSASRFRGELRATAPASALTDGPREERRPAAAFSQPAGPPGVRRRAPCSRRDGVSQLSLRSTDRWCTSPPDMKGTGEVAAESPPPGWSPARFEERARAGRRRLAARLRPGDHTWTSTPAHFKGAIHQVGGVGVGGV